MKQLLVVTALIEAAAGVAIVCFPSKMVELLMGSPLDDCPSAAIVRVAGCALLALGIACWLASRSARTGCARGWVTVMTVYNLSAATALGIVGLRSPSAGVLLWPTVVLHAAMALWCIIGLLPKAAPSGKAAQ